MRYVDHASADDLRSKYSNDPNVHQILDVDIVWDGTSPLSGAAPGSVFDCVVASHVIEHIPNPIGWLRNIATVLEPGAVVCLVVPDKRVTFDYNRRLTEASDLIDAYVREVTLPGCAQVYDFHTRAIPVVASEIWAGRADYAGQVRPGNLREEALAACVAIHQSRAFQDVHCHTFTPASFAEVFAEAYGLGILPFRMVTFVPTEVDAIEFYVRLEYLGIDSVPERPFADGVDRILADADQVPLPLSGLKARKSVFVDSEYVVSAREKRVIEAKRDAVRAVRRTVGKARSRIPGGQSPSDPGA